MVNLGKQVLQHSVRARALLVAALVLAASSPAAGQPGDGIATLSGETLGEETWQGDVIAVFFASWSPRCRKVVERANELQEQWGDRARVLLVDFQEEPDAVRRFVAGRDVGVRIALDRDGSLSKKHGITTLPSLLVLRQGSVAFRGRLPAEPDSILRPIYE